MLCWRRGGEALRTGRGVLGALTFVTVGQEHHQSAQQAPLFTARCDELIDDNLCAVGEVTELGLPDGKAIGFRRA